MVYIEAVPFVLAFVGGLLIAIASTVHLFLKGRITGMSGIFFGMLSPDSTFTWKSCIVSGILFTSCITFYVYGFSEVSDSNYVFDPPQKYASGLNTVSMVIAGLFVGIGTKLGNGCTSGHGVCGLPRFSPRSFAAVMSFMITAFATANIKYYAISTPEPILDVEDDPSQMVDIALAVSVLILLINFLTNKNGKQGVLDIVISFIVGAIFSLGLIVSGMARRSKVEGFLTINNDWDMSLIFVLGGAVMLNLATFHYIIRVRGRPVFAEKLNLPTLTKIDLKLVTGGALFGIGWGIAGICPGPAMVIAPIYFSALAKFMFGMVVGQYLANFVDGYFPKVKTPESKALVNPTTPASPDASEFQLEHSITPMQKNAHSKLG